MKKLLLILVIAIWTTAPGQPSPEFVSEFAAQADRYVGFDNLGANYYIKDNSLYKEKEGKRVQYNTLSFGRIERVDLINPMSIVVFYNDFNSVVFLDNQLNEIRRINFSDFSEPLTAIAVGNASQNRLWVYNAINQQIGLFDYLKNSVIYLSQPIRDNIAHYESDFNHFYWMDNQGNRYSCDLFGKIVSLGRFPYEPGSQFISDTSMIYIKDKELRYFTLDGNTEQLIDLGEKSPTGFWYNAQNLAIFTPEGISLYKLKLR